jgi:hypothetical protein
MSDNSDILTDDEGWAVVDTADSYSSSGPQPPLLHSSGIRNKQHAFGAATSEGAPAPKIPDCTWVPKIHFLSVDEQMPDGQINLLVA